MFNIAEWVSPCVLELPLAWLAVSLFSFLTPAPTTTTHQDGLDDEDVHAGRTTEISGYLDHNKPIFTVHAKDAWSREKRGVSGEFGWEEGAGLLKIKYCYHIAGWQYGSMTPVSSHIIFSRPTWQWDDIPPSQIRSWPQYELQKFWLAAVCCLLCPLTRPVLSRI